MTAVKLDLEGLIAVLTLNRPEQRNALSTEIAAHFLDAFAESRRRGARAIVVTGAPPAFCAGADVDDLLSKNWMEAGASGPTPYDVFATMESDPRPVIGAVNGAALGGGFELCLCCDLVIASQTAFFAFPELGLGVVPNTALGRLAGIVGRRTAADLILTRRRLNSDEAMQLSLVNNVCTPDEVLPVAIDRARRIVTDAPPSAIGVAKRALSHGSLASWVEIREAAAAVRREEWQEGLQAFRERRPPAFDRFWEEGRD